MQRERSEGGFTLIEMMAALTLMAIGIVGVIGVMNSSFKVVGTTSARSKAVALATKRIETLRAKPYDQLAPLAALTNRTTTTETIGGQTFTIEYAVQNADEATRYGSDPQQTGAYKKAFVWVKWTDQSGYHDIRQETLIYPGGLGTFSVSNSVNQAPNSTRPLRPSALTATPVSTTADVNTKNAIDLSWVPPAPTAGVPPPASWIVQYAAFDCNNALCSSFPATTVQEIAADLPGSMTTLRVNDLSGGTKYHFRVYSKSASGVVSLDYAAALNVTGITSPATTCAIGTASVTPSAVKKRGGADSSKLTTNPVVTVNVLATCTGRTFELDYSPKDGLVRTLTLTGSGATGARSATLDGGASEWSVGARELKVYSVLDGVRTLRANLRLTVCDNSKATCP